MTVAKVTITTACSGRCAICPAWKIENRDMPFDRFTFIFDKLVESEKIHHILLNSIGDIFSLNTDDPIKYLKYAEENKKDTYVSMTTNAIRMRYVPTGIDKLVISFNGGDRDSYGKTTGVSIKYAIENIWSCWEDLKRMKELEMHCLIWQGNAGCEEGFKEMWFNFPGKLRISYKYDNQFGPDYTLDRYKRPDRISCDYLSMVCVDPSGKVIMCAHDFNTETDFGNLLNESIDEVMNNSHRLIKKKLHKKGRFGGLCKKCNYNTPIEDRIVYIKE